MPWNDGVWNDGVWNDGGTLTVGAPVTVRRSATSHAIYDRFAAFRRHADERAGWTLWNYVSIIGEQSHDIVDIILGISGEPSTLADPVTTPPQWWRWLARLTGYIPTTVLSAGTGTTPFARQRLRLADPRRLRHGTRFAIVETLKDVWPTVTDNAVTVTPFWRGSRWIVRVTTSTAQIPNTGANITTWGELEESFACWADLEETVPTWLAAGLIDQVRLSISRVLAAERPLGTVWSQSRAA